MNSPFARALREAAAAPLPNGAFLRRDRGSALFVTNAPVIQPRSDWSEVFGRAGFRCIQTGGLLRLTPGTGWLAHLEQIHPDAPDSLCASLKRFSGIPPDAESLHLFAAGARALDAGAAGTRFDRLLRKRAALCLRLNRMNRDAPVQGGGLYACALLAHEIKEDKKMKLKWMGHSCFELTLPGGIIVTDPYDDSVGYPPLHVRADAVLSSHDHFDHNYFPAVEGNPVILNTPGEHEACGAKIIAAASWHDDAGGTKRGSNIIHVVEVDGLRIAHLGDLGHFPDTEEQRTALSDIDVMLIPIGGFFTIDTPTAVRIIETFKPRSAIAMHFHNRFCGFPISDESEFIRLTGAARLGNEIEITADSPAGCAVMALPEQAV